MNQAQDFKRHKRIFWCAFVFLMVVEVLLCNAIYELRTRKAQASSSVTQAEKAQKLLEGLGRNL